MKKILLKTTAIMLILAGMISCEKKDNNEPPIKLARTHWELEGIVNVETGELIELELEYPEYTGCSVLHFDTDSTAYGCNATDDIYLHLSPHQVYIVIENEDDFYTGDMQLFYDTIKTIISYTVTKDELPVTKNELKLYCNEGKNYLLYTEIVHY
ncbi:MAG: hypothetical protein LBC68_13025 [Prevotellaceae bacterium]|jgi:hypothetical protein|nr:hypothetical protein [Prevotellaceae bacterium]